MVPKVENLRAQCIAGVTVPLPRKKIKPTQCIFSFFFFLRAFRSDNRTNTKLKSRHYMIIMVCPSAAVCGPALPRCLANFSHRRQRVFSCWPGEFSLTCNHRCSCQIERFIRLLRAPDRNNRRRCYLCLLILEPMLLRKKGRSKNEYMYIMCCVYYCTCMYICEI